MKDIKFHRYALPSEKLEGWAIIVIGSDGFFATVSDYGNYAYKWSDTGEKDFRKFIISCSGDYILRKLDNSSVLDVENTQDNARHAVCLARRLQVRGYEISAELARLAYDEIGYISTEFELNDWFNSWAQYLDDYTAIACYKPAPGITAFIERTLPRLQKLLREELFKEGLLG